jgi:hypothetical protein
MNMLKFLIVFTITIFMVSCESSKTIATKGKVKPSYGYTEDANVDQPNRDKIEDRLNSAKPTINNWIGSAEYVANKADDRNAKLAVNAMKNYCLGMPIVYKGSPSTQFIAAPQNPKSPSVCFNVITEKDLEEMPQWRKMLVDQGMAAQYDRQMLLIQDSPQSRVTNRNLVGLIALHEMCHWKQDKIDGKLHGQFDPKIEIEAYEFEFGLLDKLNLPKYAEFMTVETAKPFSNQNPYLNHPDLTAMFGPMTAQESKAAATLLYLRVAFNHFNKNPATSLTIKSNFIASIYGHK